MKDLEIGLDKILFWVIIIVLIVLLVWRTFGSSPPLEALAFVLTAFGVWLGWESREGSQAVLDKLKNNSEKLDSIEQEEKKQTQILLEIKTILERK